MTIHNGPKRITSTSGGLELCYKWYQNQTPCASEDAGSQEEWIVRSHIDWKGEQSIPHEGVETSPVDRETP